MKPSNIIIHKNTLEPWILDFGIAKGINQALWEQGDNTRIGTPGYQAPEVRQGMAGPYSDIFSLCATVLCLTGSASNDDTDWDSVLPRCAFSAALKNILSRMIQQNYPERYQTCQEVIKDLKNLNADSEEKPI